MPAVEWVDVKTAAVRSGVHVNTLRRWCCRGLVVAYRLARGAGHWRVALSAQGFPVER